MRAYTWEWSEFWFMFVMGMVLALAVVRFA